MPPKKGRARSFIPVAPTAPTAGKPATERQTSQTSRTSQRPAKQEQAQPARRLAFTWRITTERANQLDSLVMRLRTEIGTTRLDRATLLEALADLAENNNAVYGSLVARLQQDVSDV